jgi:alpha/beta superfamily hydrolase
VGASAGEPSGDADDADQDFASALDHAGESAAGVLLACGYSFGAAAAVRAAERAARVRQLMLVAPPPALIAPARIAALRARVLVLTGDRDDFVPLGALQGGLAEAGNVRLEVLAGADHFFGSGTRPLSTLASAWLGPPAS